VSGRDGDPGPVPITGALDAIRREYRMPEPSELDAVTSHWAALVGDALAKHSRPQSLRSGVLVVVADAAAWAGQLRYLDQVLVERIADELPAVTVREVRVSVARAGGSEP
jgi:predicted nucleic acid-binding Zn ribbon protein